MLHQSPEWEPDHPDIPSFLTILRISPGDVLTAMGGPLCQSVSLIVGDHEKDPALRMTLLRGIDGLLQNDEQATTFCAQHGQTVLKDVILPPLIWRAGESCNQNPYTILLGPRLLGFLLDRHLVQVSQLLLFDTVHFMLCTAFSL